MSKLIFAAIVLGLIAWARKATPAHNKSGLKFIGEPQQDSANKLLTVATFNIQTGKSNDGKRDITASAEVIKNADLVGVQEVYAPSLLNLIGFGKQQTESLAKHGVFTWLFCATRRRWLREHRGNAVLSKLPVLNWRTEMLPDQSGKSYRNMTVTELQWQEQTFHFINTHLHTKGGRQQQMEVVFREFAKYPRAILVGDFNSRRDMNELDQILKDIDVIDAIEVAKLDTDNPNRIDWIFTKGFNVEGGVWLEKGVSDHPYYQVDLSYQS